MSASDLSNEIGSLSRLLSESENESCEIGLNILFDCCLKLKNSIEACSLSSSDKQYQAAVKICIQALEQCTRMVNELALFSSNETADELHTESIRYLLLPAILGSMTIAVQSSDLAERMKNVQKAEVYFKDFLYRCKNYELPVPNLHHIGLDSDEEINEKNDTPESLRERKLQHFRQRKELENLEKALKNDKESQRECHLACTGKWILISIEELENIKKEKEILEFMPQRGSTSDTEMRKTSKSQIKPFRPIIITKDEVQKQVFGVGYPSLPIFTIDDFYRQRFEKLVQNHQEISQGNSLQDRAMSGYDNNEAEEIQKEEEIERDDAAALAKVRQWDEWKEGNPRGSGNRYNKG